MKPLDSQIKQTCAVAQNGENPAPEEQSLSVRLGLKLIHAEVLNKSDEFGFYLRYSETGLSLFGTAQDAPGALTVDFTSSSVQRRCREPLRSQGLGKAIGLKRGHTPSVLDATAGLGTDTYLMAVAGCAVTALEKSAIVFALLEDGVQRARAIAGEGSSAISRVSIEHSDFLQSHIEQSAVDIVYLDPMFPEDSRSARSKKPMFLLQQLLPRGDAEKALLDAALRIASKRVVVKRARLSPTLDERLPDIQFKGRSSRYDVYLKQGRASTASPS